MKQALQDMMNDQIKHELYSAYLYLSMSSYCESINMPGAAHWMRLQAQEEVAHGDKVLRLHYRSRRSGHSPGD